MLAPSKIFFNSMFGNFVPNFGILDIDWRDSIVSTLIFDKYFASLVNPAMLKYNLKYDGRSS